MKAKLKSLCADGRPEKRRNSHQYQEFANWVESQKWYHKWNLMMNGGEDTTRGEKLANKQYRLENEKLKAQNSKLRNENLDLKEKHRVLKNSNAGLRKQLQQNQQNVTIDETKNVERVIESEPEPEPEPTHIQEPEPVKKKRPIPPQALLPEECLIESSDSDSESSDEEEVEQPEKELVFNYDNPYPVIKWEDIEHRDMEKTLRDACSDYCDILRNTYVEEVKHKGGNKATPQYEITMKFEEWFYKQKEIIDDILPDLELHKWENKFITQLEDHMEVTFCD